MHIFTHQCADSAHIIDDHTFVRDETNLMSAKTDSLLTNFDRLCVFSSTRHGVLKQCRPTSTSGRIQTASNLK